MDQETSKALKDYFERGGPVMKDGKKLVFGISRHRAYQIIKGCAKRAAVSKLISTATERRKSHRVMNKPNRRR